MDNLDLFLVESIVNTTKFSAPHFCDLCQEPITDGSKVYVGKVSDGQLVSVTDCCRKAIEQLLAEGVYSFPEEVTS